MFLKKRLDQISNATKIGDTSNYHGVVHNYIQATFCDWSTHF